MRASRKKASYLQAQFQRLRHRRGPKKAICAVAASILTAAYHMLRDGTFYQDLGASHFHRDSPENQASRPGTTNRKAWLHLRAHPRHNGDGFCLVMTCETARVKAAQIAGRVGPSRSPCVPGTERTVRLGQSWFHPR